MNTIIIILFILLVLGFIIYINIRHNLEHFYGYHPGHPSWPWYWYNFPTRMYVPTRNMITDIRGDPRCPNFGKCGKNIRSGNMLIHPEYHPSNYLWWNPTSYPHFYYYDYYYPVPRFDYTRRYDADGSMYKIKEEKIETIPSASV
jgi:hypothetical protein